MKAVTSQFAMHLNFFRFTCLLLFLTNVPLLLISCAVKDSADIISTDLTLTVSWHGDYPVSELDKLPEGQHELATGYIGDAETFILIWRRFKPTEMLPAVDFRKNIVVFSRNVHFYNRTSILKVTLQDSTAEIIAIETMSAMPIEDKVAMAMAVIAREGIIDIRAGTELIEVMPQN